MATRKKPKPAPKSTPVYTNAPKLTEAQRADVVARLAAGESQRDLAARFKVARGTIAKVVAKAAKPAPESAQAPWAGLVLDGKFAVRDNAPAEPETPDAAFDPERRAIDVLRGALAAAEAAAKSARADGSATLAQRYSRDVAGLSVALARLEKNEPEDGSIVITKEEILQIEKELESRQKAELGARPLLCADCGRKLSIKWGTGE